MKALVTRLMYNDTSGSNTQVDMYHGIVQIQPHENVQTSLELNRAFDDERDDVIVYDVIKLELYPEI